MSGPEQQVSHRTSLQEMVCQHIMAGTPRKLVDSAAESASLPKQNATLTAKWE